MTLAAEWGSGQVLWSILWIFLFVLWFWMIIAIFSDLMRDTNVSGWGKAAWVIAIILLPFLGIFVYLIVRGGSMTERSIAAAKAQDEAMQQYIRDTAGGSGTSQADQLSKLADLHAAGKIDDGEFAEAKAKVLNG